AGDASGAGTIYVLDPLQQFGHLIVDNADRVAQSGSTPLRSVGRHQIVDVYQPTNGVWKIEVSGTPWKDSDNTYGYGVDGLWVDLDGSEAASTHYQIVSNREGVLEIHTSDDLYSALGKELIGVQTFASVQLLGGSSLDIGEDRLVVLDLVNSQFAANSSLLAGEISQELIQLAGEGGAAITLRHTPQLSNLLLDNLGTSTLRFSDKVSIDQLTVTSGNVYFDGGLDVAGNLLIDNGASVYSLSITANQITVNDSQLITESISLLGDFAIGAGASVTVPAANVSAKHIYRLSVIADGQLSIAETASIDLVGKGYPNDYYAAPDFASNSSLASGHGGHRRHGKSATGRYEAAYFAGSGGDDYGVEYPGHGGGAMDISVAELVVHGSILANGQSGYILGGAGGSIYIETEKVSGGESGVITANGGGQRNRYATHTSYSAGAGGRISISTGSTEEYAGSISASSGPGDIAGAGTVYVHDLADSVGSLIVDNGGAEAQENSTPIRAIGEHQITAVKQLSPNRWRVSVADAVWQSSGQSFSHGLDGLLVSLDSTDPESALYLVISNAESSLVLESFDDLTGVVGNSLVGVHLFKSVTVSNGASVDWGGDRYQELGDAVSARDSDGDGLSDIDEVTIHQSDSYNSDTDSDGVPDGLEVALGASPIVHGDADITPYVTSLVYDTSDRVVDLEVDSNIIEFDLQALITVGDQSYLLNVDREDLFPVVFSSDSAVAQHQKDGIYLLNEGTANISASLAGLNAQVPVHISGPALQNWASQTIAMTTDRQVQALTLNNSIVDGGDYRLQVNGDALITGTSPVQVSLKQLSVAGNLVIDGASVTLDLVDGLEVAGELIVQNGATITVPNSSVTNKRISALSIFADVIKVDAGAAIDVSGRGYPGTGDSGYTWPDYQTAWFDSGHSSCHAGKRRSGDSCSYGRYERARFAGSAGDYWRSTETANGGGVIELFAREAIVNGSILADGHAGYETGGAGGSIHLEVETLAGSGLLRADGGRNHSSYSSNGNLSGAGTGGRISVYASDRSGFSGHYRAASGSYQPSGAGTVYLQNPQESYGQLIIDNAGLTAPQGSTPIRTVGRHVITGVDLIDTGIWRIEVEGEPWESTDDFLQRGLSGISVDLNALDKSGPLYPIERNTTNTITVHTEDDLSAVVGQSLVGVHTFDTVTVSGYASLDLGDDRLVLLDPAGSEITFGSSLHVGELDEASMLVFTPTAYEQGGLWGTYYDNQDFTAKRFSQVDEQINFDWGSGYPSGLQHDYFSIRWQGELEVPEDGDYTFSGRADDEIRVWIDGELVVNTTCCDGYQAEPVTLTAGRHSILVEYEQATGSTYVNLYWSYGPVFEELIPFSAFYFRNPGVSGRIIFSQVYELEESELYASAEQPITFSRSVTSRALTLQSGSVIFNEDLTVNGPLILSEFTDLTVHGRLYAESIQLADRSILNASDIESIGQIELLGDSVVRGFYANTSTREIRPLRVLADSVILSDKASIDASGRGYPGTGDSGYTWPDYQTTWFDSGHSSCHAGKRRSGDSCSYGRHERAQFAGSAGDYWYDSYTGNGGGVIELIAREIQLNGSLIANGAEGLYTGGAGGSIHLEATSLSGTGLLRANGGRNHSSYSNSGNLSGAGTGGRISVYASDRSGFTGRYQAASGSYQPSGAGTVYLQHPQESYGHLIINNANLTAPQGSTPIRTVGRHVISGADLIDTGVWRIEVEGEPWEPTDVTLQRGIAGISIDLDAVDKSGPLYRIERNTTNTITLYTEDDLSAVVGQTLVGVHTFDTITVSGNASLDLGDDRLVLLDPAGSEIAFGSSLLVGELDEVSMLVFTPTAYEQGGLWGTYYDNQDFTAKRFSQVDEQISFDWGSGYPSGLQHDYFSIRWQGELEVPEDGDYTFSGRADDEIRVWIDGALVVNTTCCGDYQADPVTLTAGRHSILVEYEQATGSTYVNLRWSYGAVTEELIPASAFHFRNPGIEGQLILSETIALTEAELHSSPEQPVTFLRPVTAGDLTLKGGSFNFRGGLQVAGTLVLSDLADVQVSQSLVADDVALISGSHLTVEKLVSDNLILNDGSKLLGFAANADTKTVSPLIVEVSGSLEIDGTSSIDVSGKGYPSENWSGPDFDTQSRAGCHGGVPSNVALDCTYGRYQRARFAGSAGRYYNAGSPGYGGGIIELYAGTVSLNGAIRANGLSGGAYNNLVTGAGGSVHIESASFAGTGSVEVIGGNNAYSTSYPAGAGGRISLYSESNSFTGELRTHAGTSGTVSGAGTAYVQLISEEYGHLIIDNGGRNAKEGSTPIRTIGRHLVTGVDQVAPGEWRLEVEGEPWRPTDLALGWGIDGITVDLDASDVAGEQYVVERNSTNTITILTSDDLSGVLGKELVGVHTLETITVTGGADVDFGDDRLVVRDPQNSRVDSGARVQAGWLNDAFLANVLESQGAVELTRPLVIETLSLSDVTSAVLKAPSVSVLSGVSLTNAALTLDTNELTVGGDVILMASSLTAPYAQSSTKTLQALDINVVGTLDIDSDSSIDVSGRGYPSEDWSGPDFETQSRGGCHGGIRFGAAEDCTYGRYQYAEFAGSAGRYYNNASPGHGGGLIRIYADTVNVDGSIRANGLNGGGYYETQVAGAGGSIHIEAQHFTGSGTLQTEGGSNSYSSNYSSGAGGRISVYTESENFIGEYRVNSGTGGRVAGAGTAYVLLSSQTHGHLIVGNGGRRAEDASTPIRTIGRHRIVGVDEVASDEWRIEVEGEPWIPTDTDLGWGIDGISVDLDASEAAGEHYKVVKNSKNTITVLTENDLSAVVGQELMGVHIFDAVTVTGGASVDFGEDRVIVLDPSASFIDAQSSLHSAEQLWDGSLVLDGRAWSLSNRDKLLQINGDLTLVNGATLSAPSAQSSSKSLYGLRLEVAGTVSIDLDSVIDVSGSGYPNDNWSGPDFETQSRGGCHGGVRRNTTADCTYGRYERARYAGSGGHYYNSSNRAYGGGLVELYAASVVLEGVIRANGENGGYHNGTQVPGAGGAIHIETQSFGGAGALEVTGGNNSYSTSYPAGSGGRISVYTEVDSFTGSFAVNSGTGGTASGAGTAFVFPLLHTYGRLIVDNASREAVEGSTPIRQVGRHTIEAVEQLSPDKWRVYVAENVWQASDNLYDWGIDGISVDLDASDGASPHYLVESNNEDSFTVRTTDDLSGVAGQELVGVHTFESISVTGGASLDFGEDRLVVLDPANSTIANGGQVRAGALDHELITAALHSAGRVEITQPLVLESLALTGVSDSTLKAPSLSISGNVSLADTTLTLDVAEFVTAGDFFLQGSSLTTRDTNSSSKAVYPITLVVGGKLAVDADSVIDVSGKGFPSENWSGPDSSDQSRGGCHGGIRSNTVEDCTYGSYQRARFPGSGGRQYGNATGFGGGLVELYVGELLLDGAVRANGANGGYYNGTQVAGSGGAIHIEAQSFSGTGMLSAVGGNNAYSNSYPAGAGGRISVYTASDSFEGEFNVNGGTGGAASGAGTAYVQLESQSFGHLIVDNAGRSANTGSTPIRAVGRHSIIAVEEIGAGEWSIQVAETPWTPTDTENGWGIDGLIVDLNSGDAGSGFYLVERNTEDTIIILTDDDLSEIVGQQLVGVHTFETVLITGGASVDFGEDRLIVLNPQASYVDAQSGVLSSEQWWEGSLTLDGQSWSLTNGAELVRISGDLTLSNGSTITAPAAQVTSKQLNSVLLQVSGTVNIDETSAIDVSGKGYPDTDWSGPDFNSQSRPGCHGGLPANAAQDCTYGRYERARYAGSGGQQYSSGTGHGGGVVELHTTNLNLDGAIRANGHNGGYYNGSQVAGAGGSIHLEVQNFSGSGSLEVTGGSNSYSASYPAGAGGRISVQTDVNGFVGTFLTNGGVSGSVSGAGTAFVREGGQTYGSLIVDNANRQSESGSTPIRTVGRLEITSVEPVADNQWRIKVAGSPWQPSDTALGWGLDGTMVDLNAGDTTSRHYRIESNTENVLTLITDDDISGVVGQELVGVHTFESIRVTGGASVSFGGDRLTVLNPSTSHIDSQSVVLSHEQIWDGSLVLDGESWALSNRDQFVQINGDLTLQNGANISAPFALTGSKSLYGLHLAVDGALVIDETSAIDVSGRGYPDTDWSGPDFLDQSRAGCHGGIRHNTAEDCTYGRLERARFAGSGGKPYGSGTGHGGGVVELYSTSISVNGAIRANGGNGGYFNGSQVAGAGGAIHIETASIVGTGTLEATGGSNLYSSVYPSGAGGRISIYTEEDTFTGELKVHGGTGGAVSGAGTAFVQRYSELYGHLIVDNNGRIANEGSTPARSVGRHQINSVTESEDGVWRVGVAESPWRPSDGTLEWGIAGIMVDLDAGEASSPHYLIESNTENTITLRTQDDLNGMLGQELQGVHRFESVTVAGGASLSFGNDRLELPSMDRLIVDPSASFIRESVMVQ
ncbi:hypothetical protein FDY93_12425, partial [Microbulbifer harenosus]